MTKKDFELIARTLKEAYDNTPYAGRVQVEAVAKRFAIELRRTNDRFDEGRFLRACLGEDA